MKKVKRGDIFYADLNGGTVGSEQSGIRPILIIQNNKGNTYSPTVICLPLTSRNSKHRLPTHVYLSGKDTDYALIEDSIILAEQPRTIDKIRLREFLGHLSDNKIKEVNAALAISMEV